MSAPSFTVEQRQRYARHLTLAEMGPVGQQRLMQSRVLIVGVGALDSPVALYLAAAGVGTIGLADHDQVRLSNLQRQVGVLAALPGIIGTIQAAETIKLITQVGDGLVNRVLLHDAMAMTFQEVRYRRNRGCPLCGDRPTIRSLVDYGAFTGAEALR